MNKRKNDINSNVVEKMQLNLINNDSIEIDLPLDWDILENNVSFDEANTSSAGDGLILSLRNLGRVDLDYISKVTNMDKDSIIFSLRGSIFQNPEKWNYNEYEGYETSEEYLSGNLKRKWLIAKRADKEEKGQRFKDNIDALEAIMPPSLTTDKIYVTLGSPWVPSDIIDDFIESLLGNKYREVYKKSDLKVVHDTITGSWEIPEKMRYGNSINLRSIYGTSKINALHIIERTLNMRSIVVYDIEKDSNSKSKKIKRVINKDETILAIEKQKLIIREFKDWIWAEPSRKKRLEKIYENKYAFYRGRKYDGSFFKFPNMNPKYSLYPYQKNAVARIIFSPNTLIAHEVGAGKTYIMIAAGMELKRMKLSNKNMYVVPNNIVLQWKQIFLNLYPNANVLCIDPSNFKPSKRQDILRKIKDENFDAIIIAYSCFEMIPLSLEEYRKKILEEKQEIEKYLKEGNKLTDKLIKKLADLSKEAFMLDIQEAKKLNDKEALIFFDDLKISRLFVDEAHNYKNIAIETKIDHVLGLSISESKKCIDMMDKVRSVQRDNDGGGVIFSTGTPITNSLTDIFVMQKYLQNGDLAMLELQNFDSWIGMFAERVTKFEVDVDTNNYRLATRFAKFHNLPELTSLLSSIADFHQMDKSDCLPIFEGYTNEEINKSNELDLYLKEISSRADKIRKGKISLKLDNMLKITTDGRKAALDLRLVNQNSKISLESKIQKCIDNVIEIYNKTKEEKGTQLIFCDISTPKIGFNIYDELKYNLIIQGVNYNEIAYIHDANTETKRDVLFKNVREGNIRILIGSTFKLGLGVNVQDKLVALHHLDVPWRPADMTQREGRILRQGNTCKQIYIYRYITKGSFDAYSWQLLETKQQFISSILEGSLTQRTGSEIDDIVLSYSEVKALAVGNPLIKERFELSNKLSKLILLRNKKRDTRFQYEIELESIIPAKKEKIFNLLLSTQGDFDLYKKSPMHNDEKEIQNEFKQKCADKIEMYLTMKDNDSSKFTREFITLINNYYGFTILLPLESNISKPYIVLKGNNSYTVELGESKKGYITRIDNRLEKLAKDIEKFKEELDRLETHKTIVINELEKTDDISDEIDELKNKIQEIDNKLGVEKNG